MQIDSIGIIRGLPQCSWLNSERFRVMVVVVTSGYFLSVPTLSCAGWWWLECSDHPTRYAGSPFVWKDSSVDYWIEHSPRRELRQGICRQVTPLAVRFVGG